MSEQRDNFDRLFIGGPLRYLFAILLAGTLVMPALALDRSGPIMEVRVYFNDLQRLDWLGDLLGELDICTWQELDHGGFLVINTDKEQLERIDATGLRTEITWPDIRDKFRYITGVDPNSDAGRDFGYFLTYWELQDTLDYLVETYPSICSKTSLGLSYQGRPLWCLKISDNPGTVENEPAMFVNGATHAREPLGTHCCVMFAAKILSEYGHDSLSTWLINNREIFVVPVTNPDGYVYNSDSGGSSSNWRKNRVPHSGSVGVDLNRNYGYKWGYDNNGSSGTPSSETYRGPSRFSEPETQVIRDFENMYLIRTCQDFHTYGRYNMYSWGYANVTPPDRAVLQEAVDTFRVNNQYPANQTGQIYSTIYPVNGGSTDWEYSDTTGKFVTYAYTCELSITDFWYGYNDSAFIRSECNKNIPNLYYLTRIAGVFFEPVSVTVNDASGNNNGRLDPGEVANIWFSVRNRATHPLDSAYAISAKLVCRDTMVTVLDSVKPFATVVRRSSGNNQANQFTLEAAGNAIPNTVVPLRLELSFTDAGHSYVQPVNFQITIGTNPVAVKEQPGADVALFRVSPNPGSNRVLFSLNRRLGPSRLEVYSSTGTRVLASELQAERAWDCSNVPAGVYFCRLTARSGETYSTRLNVAH